MAKQCNDPLQYLFDSLESEASPLPCALVAAAHIDKKLHELLTETFRNGTTSKAMLKADSGILGAMHNRAKMAYVLNLIDKSTFNNITAICTIRNIFAHSHEAATFDSHEIAKYCKDLELEKAWSEFALNTKWEEGSHRHRFVRVAIGVFLNLIYAIGSQRSKGFDFNDSKCESEPDSDEKAAGGESPSPAAF